MRVGIRPPSIVTLWEGAVFYEKIGGWFAAGLPLVQEV